MTSTTTENNNKFTRRLVSAKTLTNGNKLLIGQRAPSAANQCKLVKTIKSSYIHDQMKGQFSLHMGNGVQSYLEKQAVIFANQHPHVNYAYLYIPTTHSHGFAASKFSSSTTNDAMVVTRYFSCQNPPKENHNPF